MKSILVINDNLPETRHAALFALALAQKNNASLILANISKVEQKVTSKVYAGLLPELPATEDTYTELCDYLNTLPDAENGLKTQITAVDCSVMNEGELADFINKEQVSIVIKGAGEQVKVKADYANAGMNAILDRICCPLLMVPESWQIKPLERLAFLTDLRNARPQTLRSIADIATPWHADILVAHVCAKGLPVTVSAFANQLYNELTDRVANYKQFFLNNLQAQSLPSAIDVLTNGVHADMLVIINRQSHYEELLGSTLLERFPQNVNIPILIFPY